tara:strand:- start:1841 stop:2782 length:942 start_codon:yes stop_codon:yes gene_type:complete
MRYSATTLVSGPSVEPITTAEARRYLRLDAAIGEPAPTAPTVALAGAGSGSVNNGAHSYLVTFVTADGETEAGENSSSVSTTSLDGKVAVSAIPLGGSSVTARKIYRTEAGLTTYKLLTTLSDNTTTTYTDNVADASLGAGAPSTNTTEDPEINDLIKAARELVEEYTGRALIQQTWDLFLDDGFPVHGIYLPFAPLTSVTSVKYTDEDGNQQTWATSEYTVDTNSEQGRIVLAYDKTYPAVRDVIGNVEVRFVAGYGTARTDVPNPINNAIKSIMAHLYDNRSEVVVGSIVAKMPMASRYLLAPYKQWGGWS